MSDEFNPFPKIARLNRDVVVTEKIDGTNASVHVGEDGSIRAASRTRWITPADDNYGFAAWVERNAHELRKLGPGAHFGEWWGSGVQRGYGLKNGDKRFSLFNTARWNGETKPPCCEVVPLLATGPLADAVLSAMNQLRTLGSFAAPGFQKPEGIVVFHTASQSLFKVTLEKDEEPKGAAERKAAYLAKVSPV